MATFRRVSIEQADGGTFRINMEYLSEDGGNTPRPEAEHDITAEDLEMIMTAIMEHLYPRPHRPIGPCEPKPTVMSFPGIPGEEPIEKICADFARQELPDDASHYEEQEMKALRLAAKEIVMLRDAVRRRNEIIEGLNEKQRRHKAEIVELHSVRRRLQAEVEGLERTDTDGLTQEQREFLWLAEESAEVIKAVLKGLRFGMNNNHPSRVATNRTEIAKELGHVDSVVTRLMKRPSLDSAVIAASYIEKQNARIPGVDPDPSFDIKTGAPNLTHE